MPRISIDVTAQLTLQSVSQLTNQWVDIFAAGNHGEKGVFTDADLDGIVRNFNPTFHEPPAVIGHPEAAAPAYAWVEKLRRAGSTLQAMFKDAVPQFEEAVKSRRFPKRSVSLYKGENGWTLRHVGFLGAQPPQIKGLADIKFASEDTKSISIDFEENDMADVNEQSIVEKLWAKLSSEKKTTETVAGSTFSEAQVKEIATAAAAEAVKPLQAELDAQKKTFAESHTAAVSADAKTRVANAISKLKAAGRWVPAFDKLGVPVLFAELAKTTETVEFGEAGADGKIAKASPLDLLVTFMEQHKAIVPTSEVYSGQRAGRLAEMPKGVNAGRAAVDSNSVQFDEAVRAKMKADPKISYFDAGCAVERENPELSKPGGATAGAA
jgi:hypothetical protein